MKDKAWAIVGIIALLVAVINLLISIWIVFRVESVKLGVDSVSDTIGEWEVIVDETQK